MIAKGLEGEGEGKLVVNAYGVSALQDENVIEI